MSAQPGPTAATRKPPSIGPTSRVATGRMNWSSELACVRSSSGTRSGMIASNAGPKNAEPAPYDRAEHDEVPQLHVPGDRQRAERDEREPRSEVGARS